MASARSGHSATLLADGRLLLIGGAAASAAEVYDPDTGSVALLAGPGQERRHHSATLLADGRVLIAGGQGGAEGTFLADAWLFDPRSGRFERSGDLPQAQTGHTATLLADGRVLVAGGLATPGASTAGASLFDPATGTFTRTAAHAAPNSLYPEQRGPIWPSATVLFDGRVLLAGNFTAELFDPGTKAFRTAGTMPDPALPFGHYWHSATLLRDGTVLIAGGSDQDGAMTIGSHAKRYDPRGDRFVSAGAMAHPRALHTATLLRDGSVLLLGGETVLATPDGSTVFGGSLAKAERYAPAAAAFLDAGSMAVPRAGHTATLLRDGSVLIAGGTVFQAHPGGAARIERSVERYFPAPMACSKPLGGLAICRLRAPH